MFEELRNEATATCDGDDCDRQLADEATLSFRTDAGERRAYECACGALTISVVRDPDSTR